VPGERGGPGFTRFAQQSPDGAIESFPNNGHIAVVIEDDLG